MLHFRSEEHVDEWLEQTGHERGATIPLPVLWDLAKRWYDDRLEPKWGRRSSAERQEMLTQAGLTGPFWELA
ncbi:MAG: hypothetical protein ACRDKZ_10495 [Actinomycetota bacterium]